MDLCELFGSSKTGVLCFCLLAVIDTSVSHVFNFGVITTTINLPEFNPRRTPGLNPDSQSCTRGGISQHQHESRIRFVCDNLSNRVEDSSELYRQIEYTIVQLTTY